MDDFSQLFVLLVSHDAAFEATLCACGIHVARVTDTPSAREAAERYQFDLVILDRDAQEARRLPSQLGAPILVVSSRPKSARHLRKSADLPIVSAMLRSALQGPPADRTLVDEARLRLYSGGDLHFEAHLAREFLASAERALRLLEAGTRSWDLPQVRHEAHGLKGLCYILGASAVGRLCESLEDIGNRVDARQARSLVGQLRISLEANRRHLQASVLAVPA